MPWILYALLQAGVFVAAVESSRSHAHWLADERDRLVGKYRSARRRLAVALLLEGRASAREENARDRWGAAFAERLERADEAKHWTLATQYRYLHWNALARDGANTSQLPEPPPVDDKEWRKAPNPVDRIGGTQNPATVRRWEGNFSFPAPWPTTPNGDADDDYEDLAEVIRLVPDPKE